MNPFINKVSLRNVSGRAKIQSLIGVLSVFLAVYFSYTLYQSVITTSKVYRIATYIKTVSNLTESYLHGLIELKSYDKNSDVLKAAINEGLIEPLPGSIFQEPESIYWRVIKYDSTPDVWVFFIYSENRNDTRLIRKAIEQSAKRSSITLLIH